MAIRTRCKRFLRIDRTSRTRAAWCVRDGGGKGDGDVDGGGKGDGGDGGGDGGDQSDSGCDALV